MNRRLRLVCTYLKKNLCHSKKPACQSAFKYVISAFWFDDDGEVHG